MKTSFLTFFNHKKHHRNIYTCINTKIKTLFLTIRSIIGINIYTLTLTKNFILTFLTIKRIIVINTHTLTLNKNPILTFLTIKKHHRNIYKCTKNKKTS